MRKTCTIAIVLVLTACSSSPSRPPVVTPVPTTGSITLRWQQPPEETVEVAGYRTSCVQEGIEEPIVGQYAGETRAAVIAVVPGTWHCSAVAIGTNGETSEASNTVSKHIP
jgi:hypothetical protein